MVTVTGWMRAWPCLLVSLLLATAVSGPARANPGEFDLALADAQTGTSLEDIISGRARLGFSPLVSQGLFVIGRPGRTVWLRLRTDIPADSAAQFLVLPRQAIDHLRLHEAGPPDLVIAETGIAQPPRRARWPDYFILPLPTGAHGPTTLYLEIEGDGYLDLQPRLLGEEQVQAQASVSSRIHDLLYGGLFLIGLLALVRRWATGGRTLRVAAAAFACLAAGIVGNYHLQLTLGGVSLASIPAMPTALWVLACAPLLWATQQYAGHDKNLPQFAFVLDRVAFGLLAVGASFLLVPSQFLAQLQLAGLVLVTGTAVVCAACLLYDPRQWRWGPMLIWLALVPALLAIPLAMLQVLPASSLVRHGFQLLLAGQLAIYLLLPWIRQALHDRRRFKRVALVESSAEEKIAHAREWMISSLQAGIENAADGDMEWIAYRRLMGGLKPVLPQTAAAVIAMNYHNEDLLLVEPRSAEPRFQMLLAQRGSLLKNLSRSLAPQQIGVDFNGPDGPLQQVLLAVIPLPIERPGWGALVIERSPHVSYSDDELDLCTEFAALATTAGDEAATVMQLKQANEIDAESGVYKGGMIDQLLGRAHELAMQRRKPLSLLRVCIDGFEAMPAEATAALARKLADLIRDEIDYGETIGRFAADEFMVLLSGRPIGEARALGERICAAVRKQAIPTGPGAMLLVSLGVSQLQLGERSPQLMLERAAKALAKARQYGGNQVQAVATGNN